MGDSGCEEAMQLLSLGFNTAFILNDGHQILERLNAGGQIPDLVEEYAGKLGKPDKAREIRRVTENWPTLHLEAVNQLVRWALGKLDTEDRVTINWRGDAEHPETVTRFELRDHTLLIEFLHPPGSLRASSMGA